MTEIHNGAVYIAGPYTNGDVEQNVEAAIVAADKLAQAGFLPYVPHLSHYWHLRFPHDYEFWMERVIEWLKKCDYVLRLPGDSPGADRETELAIRFGKMVFFSIGHLLEYCLEYE